MPPPFRSRWFVGLLVVSGCVGVSAPATSGEPGEGTPEELCGPEIVPGPSPIRRMTRWEYDATVRDLLGDLTRPAAEFSAEEEALGFNNNAVALTTSPALAEKLLTAAEGVASRLTGNLGKLAWYRCDLAAEGEDACAKKFIDAFGLRAFRRPLDAADQASLFALFDEGRKLGALGADKKPLTGFDAGLQLLVVAALQSPEFLYRVELGGGEKVGPDLAKLDDFELASRLSYLFWGSLPDEALFAAAAKGELRTADQVAAQAQRLVAEPRARARVLEFHRQWLDFDRIHNAGKAASVFPGWTAELPGLLEAETEAFIEHVLFEGEGTWDALMSAPYTYVSPKLASFYGMEPPTGAADVNGMLPTPPSPTQRAGLLTQGSLLALNAHSNQTSPVHRGKLVRESFLCQNLPAPPANILITVPEPKADSTARERFAEHSSSAACRGCHSLMDPLGFAFEKYDGVGVYRETEAGKPVDDTGELVGTDVDGTFQGAPALAQKLVASKDARGCYVTQWFRFSQARGELPEDRCTIKRLERSFNEGNRDVRKLLISITQSDAFLYRRVAAPGVQP